MDKKNQVGYELGGPRVDPSNHKNQISVHPGRVQNNRLNESTDYWVGGQNCGDWSRKMLAEIGIGADKSERERLCEFNNGIGLERWLPSNDTIKNYWLLQNYFTFLILRPAPAKNAFSRFFLRLIR